MSIPIISEEWNPDRTICKVRFEIKKDLPFFAGHFPSQPLVPGAFQVQWALDHSIRLGLLNDGPIKVNRTKFKFPILPESVIDLELIQKRPFEINFKFFSNDQVFSLGRLSG